MASNIFRKPRTHQERALSADPEMEEFIRPKRNHKNLPTEWDDIQKPTKGRKPRYKDHR